LYDVTMATSSPVTSQVLPVGLVLLVASQAITRAISRPVSGMSRLPDRAVVQGEKG